MMKNEADRMANLRLTDDVVLPEREVVREERRSRIDNDPASQLGEISRAVQFLNHPYRIPIIGWDHEIEQLSTERSEEHTSELQSLMRKSYAVFCLNKKTKKHNK